jgi:hypothetical protein
VGLGFCQLRRVYIYRGAVSLGEAAVVVWVEITGILSASVCTCIYGEMCGWAQTTGSIGEAGGGFLFVLFLFLFFVWGAVGGWP